MAQDLNGHLLQALSKVRFPTFGEGGDLQGPADGSGILIGEPFCDVQAGDFRDRDGTRVSRKRFYRIPCADISLLCDGDVKTRAGAVEEAFHHIVGLKADTQFVTGEARLRDDHFRRADAELVAEMDRVLQQALRGEIFSKNARG